MGVAVFWWPLKFLKYNKIQRVCPLCDYNQNNKIISQIYLKIYIMFVEPIFLFIAVEFINVDLGLMKNYDEVKKLVFNKRTIYNMVFLIIFWLKKLCSG